MSSENNFKKIFGNSIEILEIIENAGYEAYFVGGCVRDFLMGRKFSDIDITTSATPEEVKKIFKITIDTGIKHGTVTVKHNSDYFEITTFRSESDYINHRSPEKVEFIKNLSGDLERRDFTINAMALDKTGKLFDFHNGLCDLKNKILRTVNNPNDRFEEDALRMLRTFRFSSQLSFDIAEEALESIRNKANLISFVSIERIIVEFKKLIKGKSNSKAFGQILETKINKYIPFFYEVKIFSDINKKNFEQTIFSLIIENNISIDNLKFLKLSKKEINDIKNIVVIHNKVIEGENIKLLAYYYGKEQAEFVLSYLGNVNQKINLPINNFKEVNFTTKDIQNLYKDKSPGPWIKEIVKLIEKEIILGKIKNDKKSILQYLKEKRI